MTNFPPNDDEGLYEKSPRPRRTTQADRLARFEQALARVEKRLTQIIHRLGIDAPLEGLHPCGFCAAREGAGCDLCLLVYHGRPTD